MPQDQMLGAAIRVVEQLRREILNGDLRAGERLREVETAARVNASRNTVREAFRVLAMSDLIEQRPNHGVAVVTPTVEVVRDIYAARTPIELAAVDVSPMPSDPRIANLLGSVDDAVAAAALRDWQTVLTANLHFHRHVVSFLGSPSLDVFFERLLARLRLALSVMEYEAHGHWLEDNAKIADLLVNGKRKAARALLRDYLRASERDLLAHLTVPGAPRGVAAR